MGCCGGSIPKRRRSPCTAIWIRMCTSCRISLWWWYECRQGLLPACLRGRTSAKVFLSIENSLRVMLRDTQRLSPSVTTFGAIYLLWHGAVKVGLVAALLRGQRWAYPAAIVAFLAFLVYQISRYAHTHAPELLVLSVLDVLVILLTWLEYRRL